MSSFDSKWIYLQQKFIVNGVVHAVGISKIVVKKGREDVPPIQVIKELDPSYEISEELKEEGIKFGANIRACEESLNGNGL
jgi:hypothetical protein